MSIFYPLKWFILSVPRLLILLLQETKFNTPLRVFTLEEKQKMDLKYYNKNVHQAAFVLPEFARKVGHLIIILD